MKTILNKKSNANIIIAGIFALIIGMGIARFAFTSLLPSMLENKLDISFAGLLASINYFGYLLGAIFAIFIKEVSLKVKFFRIGLFISFFSTIVLGMQTNDFVWIVSRFVAGFGSAMLMVVGSSLVMSRLNFEDKTKAMGIHFSGIGFSIVVTDILSRTVLNYSSWENAWIALSILSIILGAYSFYILDEQENKNFLKIKSNPFKIDSFVVVLIFTYFTVGIGFVVQGTFLPDIINSIEGLEGIGSNSWLLVGVAGVPSCIIWMRLASCYGSVNIILVCMILLIVSILIPTITSSLFFNLISAFLYGATFIALVGLFLNLGGKIASSNPVFLMGALTSSYGIGQITAPLYSIALIKKYHNYDSTLYLTAFIMLMGVIVLYLNKNKEKKYANN
ncbi:MFS transporter [Malaciobacter canalis]|uniref:MFS transporter n=1 Tax=Malaciobacter canalis TaxID=1912871 RepID=A0ABX4LPK1_9BACT|nr:YbfB/YjiJ family MFS transporter [Malaciobacter canalis]PHO09837.1 MFS transporter [Malaciobacter canalis]QEE33456.1 major facilitator superfamily transporter [Malaciobacter canalis]